MADTLLSGDAFNNEQSQKLFEVIDELHSCGAKAYIDLPEIVIVGDQSSGKSSLLQSLTDIPFPVAGRLCTRFPTRIVSRRTPGGPDVTKITIEATISGFFEKAPSASFEREQKYAEFERSGNDLSEKDFTRAVDDAMRLMGISVDPEDAGTKPNFSSDVLRIELSGPNRSHFSILDVPGVFQSRTKDVTAREMEGVKTLVSAEMRRKQSLVVCVANGTSDLATQAIFEMASKEDPFGERTIGVITKCDLTQHPDLVVRLARNDKDGDIYFQHGWFVVRNRTPSETFDGIDSTERQLREEKLFDSFPWNTLPSSRRGVQALKKHLADLLYSKMQEAFPKMLADIQDRIRSTSTALGLLGSDRSSIERKRTYLATIATRFHAIALDVLRGRYDMIEGDKLKLRKQVRDANDGFMRELKSSGHRVPFVTIPKLQLLEGNSSISAQGTSQPTGSSLFPSTHTNAQAAGGSGGLNFGKPEPINVGSVPGTRDTSFQPQTHVANSSVPDYDCYQSISYMPSFSKFSPEELRLKDYVQGQSTSNNNGNVFGAAWNPAPATSKPATTTDANGNLGTGFSQYASNNKATSSSIASKDSQSNSTGGFGGSLFAQPAKDSQANTSGSGGSVFGTSGFGSIPSGSTSDNKPTTSIFRSQPSEKPTGGLFGSTPDNRPNTGLFGSAPNNKSTTGIFGNQPSEKPAAGLFGSTPNNTSTTNAFGSNSSDKPAASLVGSTQDAKPTPSFFGPTPGHKPNSPPTKPANSPTPGLGNTDPQDAEIYRWIRSEVQANRGTELQGTLNVDILPMLFHQQASKWGDIAEKHFTTVVKFSLSILNGILDIVECDRITKRQIRPLIYDASDARQDENIDTLRERFNNIRSRHLQTSNSLFEAKVTLARERRFQAALDRYRVLQQEKNLKNLFAGNSFQTPTPADPNFQFVVDMRDTAQLFSELHMSNSRNLENEIHDTLKAYYEIAREDYVEYVTQHVVENFINSEKGPVLIFSPLYVAGLSDEQIEELAVEDEGVVKDRIEKEAALKRLKSAERIALRYA